MKRKISNTIKLPSHQGQTYRNTYLYSLPYNLVIRKSQMTPTKLNLLSYMIEIFVHYIYQLHVSVFINIYTNFARLPERKQQKYSPVQATFFLKPIMKFVTVMKNSDLSVTYEN